MIVSLAIPEHCQAVCCFDIIFQSVKVRRLHSVKNKHYPTFQSDPVETTQHHFDLWPDRALNLLIELPRNIFTFFRICLNSMAPLLRCSGFLAVPRSPSEFLLSTEFKPLCMSCDSLIVFSLIACLGLSFLVSVACWWFCWGTPFWAVLVSFCTFEFEPCEAVDTLGYCCSFARDSCSGCFEVEDADWDFRILESGVFLSSSPYAAKVCAKSSIAVAPQNNRLQEWHKHKHAAWHKDYLSKLDGDYRFHTKAIRELHHCLVSSNCRNCFEALIGMTSTTIK